MVSKITREGMGGEVTTTSTYDEARPGFDNVGKLTSLANPQATIRLDRVLHAAITLTLSRVPPAAR